ncbi:MAG: hypothetical protein WBO04_05630 [Steroidobacteraceae bacterium]
MDFSGKVSVEKNGRSGSVHVAIDGRRLRFYWEYGGGDRIAMLAVPTEAEWSVLDPRREFGRGSFLAGLAREIARHECPHATIEIAPEAVYFLEPS